MEPVQNGVYMAGGTGTVANLVAIGDHSGVGMIAASSDPMTSTGCSFDRFDIGARLESANSDIDGCTFKNCRTYGVNASADAPIKNCVMRDNRLGLMLWRVTPDLAGTTFSGNQDYDVYLMGQAWGQYSGDLTLRSTDGVSKVGITADHYGGQVYWSDGTLGLEGPMEVVQSSPEGELYIADGGALIAEGVNSCGRRQMPDGVGSARSPPTLRIADELYRGEPYRRG